MRFLVFLWAFVAAAADGRARYTVDVKYAAETSRLEGRETIRFRNGTAKPIERIVLRWYGDVLRVKADGVEARRPGGVYSAVVFELPQAVTPGAWGEIEVEFGAKLALDARTGSALASFLSPRLWWGYWTLDDYDVGLTVPEGYTAAASGRWDAKRKRYRAEGARVFGLFLGRGYESLDADAGGVQVRAVFTKEGRKCAELLVKTAADAIGFYRERYGFYPQRSLAIVPGMDYPAGGYPPATALVVIHGQHRLAEKPEAFWRWITVHEIGHMYWGDSVLGQGTEPLSWLMIGLGIRADQEYRRARGIGEGVGALERNYVNGVAAGRDTTMDVTEEQRLAIRWDFNNVVTHGKSAAMLNALEAQMGKQAFGRLYGRCLKEYAGRQLGWREFQRVAEMVGGEDLGWFFEQWVRTSRSAMYKVVGQECKEARGSFDCTVRIEMTGAMRIPVTVAARFEDGSEQRGRTDRLATVDELRFRARSGIKEVVIEPDGEVAMAESREK